jgi:hypothetical protein
MMLIIGMVSAGVAFNHQLALTHSAREASRYAATLPVTNFPSMNAWLDEIAASAVDNATGSLDTGTAGLVMCVAYVHPNGTVALDVTTSRTVMGAGAPTYANSTCFSDGRPADERRVQVSVERDIGFNALFFSTTIDLDSMAVSRFEAAGGF